MTVFRFGRCEFDDDARELRVGGAPVHLEPQVLDVLGYLLHHRARLVPKTELLDEVWGNRFVSESALTSRIKAARRAIEDDGRQQQLIRTERGRGYRFVGEVRTGDVRTGEVRTGEVRTVERDGPAAPARTALPPARGRLIGRHEDLERVESLLAGHRVVTVTGPGGAGKSTLAMALARRRADGDTAPGHEGGSDVVLVELAPVRDRASVPRAVAEATGVQGAGDVAALAASLGPRPVLLLLDNCEHLVDASAELVDAVLDAGSGARVLVTSREPLRVDGEAVHSIGSLGPAAAELFAERAVAAAGPAVVAAGDPRVVELCERLDGLPLAIELAAAQLRHLSLSDLAGRLDDRLGLLVGGRPRVGARHTALATTIEWSYQLLDDPARRLFETLGVFPASFDLPTAQAVAAELDPLTVTNTLGDLVAKSLVVHDPPTGRYRLLESIRLFAGRRLEAERRAELVERLRCHVVQRSTAMPRTQCWLSASLAARSRDDLENVRLAFRASLARDEPGAAVDIALSLCTLWRNAVSYEEGKRWVAELSDRSLSDRDRMWSWLLAADVGLGSGNARLVADAADEALALDPQVDDPGATALAALYRAVVQLIRPATAAARLAEARDRARGAGEPGLERLARAYRVVALCMLGERPGLGPEVRALTEPDGGNEYDRYICLWAAWMTALADRNGPALRRLMDAQLANVRASGLQENWLTMFCHALTLIGEGEDHLPQLRRARQRAEAEGRHAAADCVLALAYAAACRGEPARAAELLGAVGGTLFHDTANFLSHAIIRDQVVRPMLDADTFTAATARGEGYAIADVLDEHGI